MKLTIKVKKEVDVQTLLVKAGVRYWEDTTVYRAILIQEINGIWMACQFTVQPGKPGKRSNRDGIGM